MNVPRPTDSKPGVIHRGVIGGGAVSSPGEDGDASVEVPPPSRFALKLALALVLFAVVIAVVATVTRGGIG